MKSRALQLVKKLKANKEIVGWNDHGQMVFEGRTIPRTNVIDLINDTTPKKKLQPCGLATIFKSIRAFKRTRRDHKKRRTSKHGKSIYKQVHRYTSDIIATAFGNKESQDENETCKKNTL